METFGIDAFYLLPRYTTTISEQLIQTVNNQSPLGNIYQGLVQFIVNKYGGVEHLPLQKYQSCSHITHR